LGAAWHVWPCVGCNLGSSSLCIIPISEPLVGDSCAPMEAGASATQCHGEVASASRGMIRAAWAFALPMVLAN